MRIEGRWSGIAGVLLLGMLVLGCRGQSSKDLERDLGEARESGVEWPVVVSSTGRAIVEATVNGEDHGPFMLSTALRAIAMAPSAARDAGLEPAADIERETTGGVVLVKVWEADVVEVGPVRVERALVVELDELDSPFSPRVTGTRVAGVAGLPVLERAIVEIDYGMGTGRLLVGALGYGGGQDARPPGLELGGAGFQPAALAPDWRPLLIRNRLPLVECEFEGGRGLFLLDLTVGPAVLFFPEALEHVPGLAEKQQGRYARLGVGGLHWDRQGTLDRFVIGGVVRSDVEAVFAKRPPVRPGLDPDVIGIVGVRMFEGQTLALDIGAGRFAVGEPALARGAPMLSSGE